MDNFFVKISQYLDSEGKYEKADKIDSFLKVAQFNMFIGTGERQRLQPDPMFDVMNQMGLTSGFNPILRSGPGRSYTGEKLSQLTPQQIMYLKSTMSPTDFARMIETEQVGTAGNLARFIQGKGLADLGNILRTVSQALNQPRIDPNTGRSIQLTNDDKRKIFKDRFAEPISSYISGMIQSENNVNAIANAINQIGMTFNFPEMNQPDGAIHNGVKDALQNMSPYATNNPNIIKKYEEIQKHPFLSQFTRMF